MINRLIYAFLRASINLTHLLNRMNARLGGLYIKRTRPLEYKQILETRWKIAKMVKDMQEEVTTK